MREVTSSRCRCTGQAQRRQNVIYGAPNTSIRRKSARDKTITATTRQSISHPK